MNYFNNTEIAFALKSNAELERAYFLFKIVQSEPLVKIGTSLTNFAIKARLPIHGLIKISVFNHFCGGVDIEDCLKTVERMKTKNVYGILDYSVEGKENDEEFDRAVTTTIDTIKFASEKSGTPYAVFKPTGLGRFDLYEKLSSGQALTPQEHAEWDKVVARYEAICSEAAKRDIRVLIDAEESWMQDAADDLVLDMMRKYNREKAVVYTTLQLYRHDRLSYLEEVNQIAMEEGFHFGAKLVRGAYMEKERERAAEKGYPSPINPDKAATDRCYNEALRFMVDNLDHMAIYAGTHNEESAFLLKTLMDEKGLAHTDPRVWFGQLYGMSDHITYTLASDGFNTSKYLPFGPVKDVMPYLIRRAEENTSVAGQTSRELDLLITERTRRKLGNKEEVMIG